MKSKLYLPALAIMLSTASLSAHASTVNSKLKETVAGMTEEQKNARMEAMKGRVVEIKEIKRSDLSRIERKDLRVELNNMNKEAKELGHGGVYITIGGIVIIILVLILIL